MIKYLSFLVILSLFLPVFSQKNEIAVDGLVIPIENAPKFIGALNYYRTVATKWDIGLRVGFLQQEAKTAISASNYFHYSFQKVDAITRFSLLNNKYFHWTIEGGLSMGQFTQKSNNLCTAWSGSEEYELIQMKENLYGFSTGMSLEAKIGKHFHAGANLIANFYPNSLFRVPTNLPTLRVGYCW